MPYTIRPQKRQPAKIPASYWREQEIKHLGKKPTAYQVAKEGVRVASRTPQEIHRVGEWISYKGKLARVERVTKEGTYIRKFKQEEGFAIPEKKQTFVAEGKYEKEVSPMFYNFVPIFSWRMPLVIK
jgi:hypothetical protein